MPYRHFYTDFLDQNSIVSITDSAGTIIYVNDKFCEISKYSRSELIGKNHRIINSDYHPKEFFEGLWNTISGGKTWQGEVCNKDKNGKIYWVYSFIKPELDEHGVPTKYYSFRIDITDQKNREEELFYVTVNKLGNLFETSQGFQFFIDKEGELISVNKAGAALPGLSNESDLLNSHNGTFRFSRFFKDFNTHFKASLKGKEVKLEQKMDFFLNGKEKWYLITYYPVIHLTGQVIGVSLSAIDINDWKNAEMELILAYEHKKVLLESISEPVFLKDGEGRWLTINKAAYELFHLDGYDWQGKADLEMAIERPDFKDMYESCHKSDELTWQLGETTETNEIIFGDEYLTKKYPLYHKDGRRRSLVVFRYNISLSKRRQRTLNLQSKKLTRIAWLQAHMARAPVARILGLVNIINLSDANDPLNKITLERLVESAKELDIAIHEIMDFVHDDYSLMTIDS